tara:strand:- start:82 stop:705 length:624 start_codon:yes stop_codon:yes gene_type:complete
MKIDGTSLLTNTSKMPGKSIGIGAKRCHVGSKLVNVKGSTCEGCYALKGAYTWSSYKQAEVKRFNLIANEPVKFKDMMVTGLRRLKKPEFRWFDSGDVQSTAMANNILDICEATPNLIHWIPSRETKIWKNVLKHRKLPSNVTLRVSAAMIDGKPSKQFSNTSTVHTSESNVQSGTHICPAPKQEGKCGDCRACWNREVKNVSYHKH